MSNEDKLRSDKPVLLTGQMPADNDMPPSNILNLPSSLAMPEFSMRNYSNLYATSVCSQTCKQTHAKLNRLRIELLLISCLSESFD